MRPQPITVIEPQIRELVAGRLSRIYRPVSSRLERAAPGDILWIREPFWLPSCYDHLAPSQAAERGAVPNFVSDFLPEELLGLPRKRRYARELLRIWHRQHLRITAVQLCRLATVTSFDRIEEQGFENLMDFIRAWDSNLSLGRADQEWSKDPEILVIEFDKIDAPISDHEFGGMSPRAEGEMRDPSPPKRVPNASTNLRTNEGKANV